MLNLKFSPSVWSGKEIHRRGLHALYPWKMMTFQTKTLVGACIILFQAGCTLLGHNIDKRIEATQPAPSGTGRPSIPVQKAHANVFAPVGEEVDKAIFKSLTRRRTQHDMAWRDVQDCLEEETKVCSISSGCRCEEKK
ncbi:hypothetical protein [Noviherbaspirillum aerium]|uniref:hypothetical protein n=1 Tax=Noviherbaspirillum aerium TaxID=2588497 RepID=UPI00124E7E85|nr:hypothetical protein [Noviherbaspirillum aerium]